MLAALPSAVGSARRFARRRLDEEGLGALREDVELVVSELVTNAVTATGITAAHPSWGLLYDRVNVIRVGLWRHGRSVIIEVWDVSTEIPRRRDAGEDDEGGRGLPLIEALTERWGWRLPSTGGKTVWAECAVPTPYRCDGARSR